ncbi:hypothetical protein V7151_27105 [Priestia megaterium]|uniref:hypothetical protein n=1 Tax=Priestia megaterium TaxID=1404 RepID=UPI003000D2B9
MARKTDEEKLKELELKMEQIKARKQQVEARLKEKERKARTKRLIEVGAIFEKYFEIEGQEEAEKIAMAFQKSVNENKEKILNYPLAEIEKKKAIQEAASVKE